MTNIFKELETSTERFVLVKLNDDEYYPYYTIQAHNSYVDHKLNFEKLNFPQLEVLLDFTYDTNI